MNSKIVFDKYLYDYAILFYARQKSKELTFITTCSITFEVRLKTHLSNFNLHISLEEKIGLGLKQFVLGIFHTFLKLKLQSK
jgi:hypothetical protein